jgi:predicted hotdog family 3-hydroxylacyl-ACP dehydratase
MGIPDIIIAEGDSLLELIPQRPPMVMIDKLHACEDKTTTCSLTISPSNIFCVDDEFKEPGLIENIAQTAAARMGYICKKDQKEVPLGFIGGIKGLKIYGLPKAGSVIITEVEVTLELFDCTVISGKVFCNQQLLAECEMKVFLIKT